jgi:hypothetical protein
MNFSTRLTSLSVVLASCAAFQPIATKLAPIAKGAAEFDLLAHASLLDAKPDAALAYEKSAVAAGPNCTGSSRSFP